MIVTYRDVEVKDGSPLADLLAAAPTLAGYERLSLRPLDREDAHRLARTLAGSRLGDDLLNALLARAEGSPLFILELLRSVLDEGPSDVTGRDTAAIELPTGLRALIDRRLGKLTRPALRIMSAAAVIGRELDARELEESVARPRTEILRALDTPVRARILVASGDGVARYRFVHALLRERLYERLKTGERSELHRAVATMLEKLHGSELDRYLPEIADHFARGALAGDADKALAFGIRAGRAAMQRHAHEEAVRHFARALAVARTYALDDGARCEALIGLAEAEQCAGAQSASVRMPRTKPAFRRGRSSRTSVSARRSAGSPSVSASVTSSTSPTPRSRSGRRNEFERPPA